ncbi:hypothetical protein EJ04DRAFT_252730 [Polyplosphaeria fusca]|uniref:Uncharacterized protein n=1 Tax=Polyplosphaeria fusca TaxID=682080 RepID=A0A9P4QZV5_9PLEO|nr:hypothetical protein EJ04DRAFT_252730 [Polyplosphaeria fusca]
MVESTTGTMAWSRALSRKASTPCSRVVASSGTPRFLRSHAFSIHVMSSDPAGLDDRNRTVHVSRSQAKKQVQREREKKLPRRNSAQRLAIGRAMQTIRCAHPCPTRNLSDILQISCPGTRRGAQLEQDLARKRNGLGSLSWRGHVQCRTLPAVTREMPR